MKKVTVTVKDLRPHDYDDSKVSHRCIPYYEVLTMRNTTEHRIGERLTENQIIRMNCDANYEVNVKG